MVHRQGFPIGVALATPGTVAYLTTYTAVSKRVRAAELPPVVAHAVGATVAEMVAGVFFVPMEVRQTDRRRRSHRLTST